MSESKPTPRKIRRQSQWTGRINEMTIAMTDEQFAEVNAQRRRPMQQILPGASATEREFLISGMSADEQSEMFGEI